MGTAPLPPQADQIRKIVDDRLAQAEREDGEKITVEWRGAQSFRRVISLPVDLLYYNPDTHRIRAQRTLDPIRDAELALNPWGAEGQNYLDHLLKTQPSMPGKRDPEFEALRDSLADFGQQAPGLITPSGVLVNGNTRCAALRELGKQYIRVGVLPNDTTLEDVSAVELSLQLRRENKRDYSYINQLIAIEEQLSRGRRPEEVAREFHIRAKTLEQDRWVYALILDAIERSKDPEGIGLRLVDFEDHQEKLRELHRAYIKESSTNRDAAEALKESRLAMIMVGFAKTDVRIAKPDFHERYLQAKLPERLRDNGTDGGARIEIPGLGRSVTGDSKTVLAARKLTNQVLKAQAKRRNGTEIEPAQQIKAEELIVDVKKSVEKALTYAGRDERLRQKRVAAAERITDASEIIEMASGDVAQALATKSVDDDAIDEALMSLRSSLVRLATQITRAMQDPGEGTAWLSAATRGEPGV